MAEVAVEEVKAPEAENPVVAPPNQEAGAVPEKKQESRVYTQEEMDKITAKVKKNAAYRARKEAEAYYKGLQQGTGLNKPEPVKPVVEKTPERGDFETYEAFLDAKARHTASTVAREERAKAEEEAKARAAAESQAKALQTFQAKTREKFPDIEERLEAIGHIEMPQGMGEAITDSELGPEILDHLAKNPKDCERIASLAPSAALREIGKLEARLEGEAKKPEPVKPASKAPDPIKPGGSASAPVDDKPSDKDSIEDWIRKEEARVRKLRGY